MLAFTFLLALLASLLQGILLPGFSLCTIATWIALVILKKPLLQTLWLTPLAGLILDLLSDHPFGVHALAFTLTAALLYPMRRHFAADSVLHLALFSTLISAISSLLLLFLLFLFDRRVPFGGRWALVDVIVMPLFDGAFAALWFGWPLLLLAKMRKIWDLFWIKRKNLSPT